MTKPKPPHLRHPSGRKPGNPADYRRWTLIEIRGHCFVTVNDCWEWRLAPGKAPSSEHARRYTNVMHGGETVLVRRLAWELANGRSVPQGMRVLPVRCENQRCNNPFHNKPVTEAQKSQLAAARGAFSSPHRRQAVAEGRRRSASAVLDMDKARAIRVMTGPAHEHCTAFGISVSMFNRIRAGKAWREEF